MSFASSYTGNNGYKDMMDNVQERGAKIETAVKEQIVEVVVATIRQFMKDEVFLGFVKETLMVVFAKPKAPPAERLNILLLGYIEYRAPAPSDKRDSQHKLLTCFGQKLTDVFKNDGDFAAATQTVIVAEKLQHRYGITPATAAETLQKARDLHTFVSGTSLLPTSNHGSPTTSHPSKAIDPTTKT